MDDDEEITAEMIAAGNQAGEDWHAAGQPGPLHYSVYHAMRGAVGADVEAERVDFTREMLDAGIAGEQEWHATGQSGPKVVMIYKRIRAAA